MKKIILFVCLLLTLSALSASKMSEQIAYVHQKYGSNASHPIIIFDRDEIGWRLARVNGFIDTSKQIEVLQQYIRELGGIEIPADSIEFLIPYITMSELKNYAMAQPFVTGPDMSYSFCAVFPAGANGNKRLAHERMLGMENSEVYFDMGYDQLLPRMEFDEMINFSLFHELSHCLDTTYIVEAMKFGDVSRYVHQTESFADTMALMLLAKEGMVQLGEKRAIHRAIYSRKMGPYLAAHSYLGMGNPHFELGGAIYYLYPTLMAAQKFLDENDVDTSSFDDLKKRTEDIVNTAVPDSRSFMAIANLLRFDMDETLAKYKKHAEDWEEMFEVPYQTQLNYLETTDAILENSFSPSGTLPIGDSLLDFELTSFCEAFNANDKKSFFERLENFRKDLESFTTSEEIQYQRAMDLDDIFSNIATVCI